MLGSYVKNKREELGWTRNKLATQSGVSHTEIQRIEDGIRTTPSAANLRKLADAMKVPYRTILVEAGYTEGTFDAGKAFPLEMSNKQKDAAERVMDMLSRSYSSLKDEDYQQIASQVENLIKYAEDKNRDTK